MFAFTHNHTPDERMITIMTKNATRSAIKKSKAAAPGITHAANLYYDHTEREPAVCTTPLHL